MMASANTNKTILYLAVSAVLIFLAVKLWPAIRKAIGGGSSGAGGGGGAGGAGAAYQDPYREQPQQSKGSSLGASLGTGSGSGSGSGNSGTIPGEITLDQWVQDVSSGIANAQANPESLGYTDNPADMAALDDAGIQYEALQNFDVNQMATDVPGYDDTSALSGSDAGLDTTAYIGDDYLSGDYGSYGDYGGSDIGYGVGDYGGGDAGDTEGL
jgi:hypothetical protein